MKTALLLAIGGVLLLVAGLAAAALWLQRRPAPAGRPAERLIIHDFGPVQLTTPEARERMRQVWMRADRRAEK